MRWNELVVPITWILLALFRDRDASVEVSVFGVQEECERPDANLNTETRNLPRRANFANPYKPPVFSQQAVS